MDLRKHDNQLFILYNTPQEHTNTFRIFIYYYSPTWFGRFLDHHQDVMTEYTEYTNKCTKCISETIRYRRKYLEWSIHLWRYSPFRAFASLIRCPHSSLFAALLLHPLIPSSCSASLWTTSAHLLLGLPTGLVVWKFPFRIFFWILSSYILIIWPVHSSLLILMSSAMFGSLYKLQSSLFHLGRQHPPSCVGPYILHNIFLSNRFSICSDICVKVQVMLVFSDPCGNIGRLKCYIIFAFICMFLVFLYDSPVMSAEATKTCRWIVIYNNIKYIQINQTTRCISLSDLLPVV
jgi:hypothetical protein